MITITEENYLKAIFVLSQESGQTTVNVLSQKLNIKMPTVTSMMKKLAEKGFVDFEAYKPIHLTEQGKSEAVLILRKHRLTEAFLTEIMGLGWEDVHSIAEQIEHIQSPLFFDKMDDMLNHPAIDPHGESIPTKDGSIIQPSKTRLSDFKVGDVVIFTAVNDSSRDFLTFLNGRNLKLHTKIKIEHIEPYDNSIKVSYDNRSENLSKLVADKILVELC